MSHKTTTAQAHTLSVKRTAHYFTLGTPGDHIERYWFVIHGYAQLASTFIYNFSDLDDGKTLIVAPEGLNYFYWNEKGGFGGKPKATWMTSQHRLDEINDYTNYLQQLYEQFAQQIPSTAHKTVLGFSQGVQTTCRWLLNKKLNIDALILWAGMFPDDLDYSLHRAYLNNLKIIYVKGNQDPLLTPERFKKHTAFVEKIGLKYEMLTFEGKHEVDRNTILKLAK